MMLLVLIKLMADGITSITKNCVYTQKRGVEGTPEGGRFCNYGDEIFSA